MPTFSSTVQTPEGSFFPVVDASGNRVAGICYLTQLSDINSIPAPNRVLGAICSVHNGTDSKVYQFSGTSIDAWEDQALWIPISGATPEGILGVAFSAVLRGKVYPQGKWTGSAISSTQISEQFLIKRYATEEVGYSIDNSRNIVSTLPLNNWANEVIHGTLHGVNVNTPVLSAKYILNIQCGPSVYPGVHANSSDGLTTLTDTQLALVGNSSWQAFPTSDADSLAIFSYIDSIPAGLLPSLRYMYFGQQASGASVYYMGFKYWNYVPGTASHLDPANWVRINTTATPIILQVGTFAGNVFTPVGPGAASFLGPKSDKPGGFYGSVNGNGTNGIAVVDDLSSLNFRVKLSPEFASYLAEEYAATNTTSGLDYDIEIHLQL